MYEKPFVRGFCLFEDIWYNKFVKILQVLKQELKRKDLIYPELSYQYSGDFV